MNGGAIIYLHNAMPFGVKRDTKKMLSEQMPKGMIAQFNSLCKRILTSTLEYVRT
jgi:hypothetical protein